MFTCDFILFVNSSLNINWAPSAAPGVLVMWQSWLRFSSHCLIR